jgi:hypothetical protein
MRSNAFPPGPVILGGLIGLLALMAAPPANAKGVEFIFP